MKVYLLTLLLSLAALDGQSQNPSRQLLLLKEYMSGAFNSQLQSESDSAYFPIALHMKPIWKNREDGFWLYVEQAMMSMAEKPYRQRVYHLHETNDQKLISEVYELRDPLRFAGDYESDEPLTGQTIDSLIHRSGCAIGLERMPDETFSGRTGDKSCPSSLRGASYATSEVTISKSMLISWDRGFDQSGKQVWGAEKGGYRFAKSKRYE